MAIPKTRPPLVLTPGEPAGIAPEITASAWQALRHDPAKTFCVIGDETFFKSRSTAGTFKIIIDAQEAHGIFAEAIPVLHRPLPFQPMVGKLNTKNSPWVIAAIEEAVALCLNGHASAIVTNPIQKEALYDVGFKFQGHTDFLAHLARSQGYNPTDVMMLVGEGLRAVPVTVHIPLSEVPKALTKEAIVAQGKVVTTALTKYFGIAHPRLAVTGLNPHAGENGAMGQEDQTIVAPAVAELRAAGITTQGPLPADTAFHPEARTTYDAILCMYHDQALIPVKTLDFHGGVNVTLGLPFIRTSPDHGTALSLAGTGKANPSSLIAAIKLAASMAAHNE
jgi:4-hydroxythreonine-4-phosphate dehydrogenase